MANVTNRVLWWALVVSLLVYAVVAHVASPEPDSEPPALVPILFWVFAATSLGFAVGTLVYRRRALVEPIQASRLDTGTPEGLARAFPAFVINLVISESVGIYGLVLAFLSGRPAYWLPFISGALVLMFLHRPTAPDLVAPTARAGAAP